MVEYKYPKYGEPYANESVAAAAVSFYRFLRSASAGTVQHAGAEATDVVAVSVPDELMFTSDGSGGRTTRTGIPQYQPVPAWATGVCYVQLGSGGGSAGQQVKSDANGKAVVYTPPTLSATPTDTEVTAVRNAHLIVQGTLMETGIGDAIVKINLDRR